MNQLVIRLSFCLCLLGEPVSLFADHLAGAEISYSYIGNLTNTPNHYRVELRLYRDVAGAPLPGTQNVRVYSSCYPELSLQLFRSIPPGELPFGDQGYTTPEFYECVSPNMTGLTISIHYYSGTVILPGDCHDFRFYWWGGARNASNNLSAAPAQSLFVHATLNNTTGPNSSPSFILPGAKAFCAGSQFQWSQQTTEGDGDSLFYRLVSPLAGSSFPPMQLTYNPGFSANQPLSTAPGTGGVQLDSSTGLLVFTTAFVQQVAVLAVEVQEFRRIPSGGYAHVGSSMRDMQVAIASACRQEVIDGPQLSSDAPGFAIDTLSGDLVHAVVNQPVPHDSIADTDSRTAVAYGLGSIPYDCYQKRIRLLFDQ